jgi:hypothetical protein
VKILSIREPRFEPFLSLVIGTGGDEGRIDTELLLRDGEAARRGESLRCRLEVVVARWSDIFGAEALVNITLDTQEENEGISGISSKKSNGECSSLSIDKKLSKRNASFTFTSFRALVSI